jgi:hypothetical protein
MCIIAAAVIGVCCYGYAAVRIYLPVTLFLIILVNARSMWNFIRSRDGLRCCVAFVATSMIVVGPLAWKQLTDPNISARAAETRVWQADDSVITAIEKVVGRIPAHFSIRNLFMWTHQFVPLDPTDGYGWLHWFMLPLLVCGVVAIVLRLRRSASARTLAVLVLCYPIADLAFSDSTGIHPLRCFVGIVGLCVCAALGAVAATRRIYSPNVMVARAAIASFAAWVIISHLFFALYFFGEFNEQSDRLLSRRVDLMQACDWLRPRMNSVDAVFCTEKDMLIPHDNLLMWLEYSPKQWFDEPRDYSTGRAPYYRRTVCTRFGKVRIMYHPDESAMELQQLASNGRTDHVVLILRLDQISLAGLERPKRLIGPPDNPWLVIYEYDI